MPLLLLLACRAPVVEDPELCRGVAAFQGESRLALALPPGSSPRGLAVAAAASACRGEIGGAEVGPSWEPVHLLDDSPARSDCGQPIWVVRRRPPARGTQGLLVIVDTMRPDHVSPERTPAIQAHAESAWHPRRVYAPSPWTFPSVTALLTGAPPWAWLGPRDEVLPREAVTIAELLPRHRRWFITDNAYTHAASGLGQGFDRVAEVRDDGEALDRAERWWAEPANGPRLLVVHLLGPHLPYEPHPPPPGRSPRVGDQFWDLDGWESYTDPADRARIALLYAGDVRDADRSVARLLAMVGPDTVTAVVSDHGEELWEHGGFEHGHALWDEVVRVHAAVKVPGEEPSSPPGLWHLHDAGQRFARALGAADPGTWAPPSRVARLGYLLYRDRAVHRAGIVAPEGELLMGRQPMVRGDEAALRRRLAEARRAWRRPGTETVSRCRVPVRAGEPLHLPPGARWPPEQPPASWGTAWRTAGGISVIPARSGTWELEDAGMGDCRIETRTPARAFDEAEREQLRALGYAE